MEPAIYLKTGRNLKHQKKTLGRAGVPTSDDGFARLSNHHGQPHKSKNVRAYAAASRLSDVSSMQELSSILSLDARRGWDGLRLSSTSRDQRTPWLTDPSP